MIKQLSALVLAVCFAVSAHAITYEVTLSGSLTQTLEPAGNPLDLPSLTGWEFVYCLDADSEPLTMADIFANTDTNENGFFKAFAGAVTVASGELDILNLFPTQFTAQTTAFIAGWNVIAQIHDSHLTLEISDLPDAYLYNGTIGFQVAEKQSVPDSGSTAALAGLGLLCLLGIRRFRASR